MSKSPTRTLHSYHIFEKNLKGEPYSVVMKDELMDRVLLFESNVITEISTDEFVQIQQNYRKLIDAYGCLGILQMNSNDHGLSYLIMITQYLSIGQIYNDVIFKIESVKLIPLQSVPIETPQSVQELRKFLSNHHFYFSRERYRATQEELLRNKEKERGVRFDLTLCAQRRQKTSTIDNRFFWNRRLYLVFFRYGINADDWLEKCIFGCVDIKSIHYEKFNIHLALISRISNENTGTSYINRGVDDNGHVAMAIETEQAIYLENTVVSYIQIRGSVPIFWKHTITPLGVPKIQLTRGFEMTQQAFEKHIRLLQKRYGDIAIISLLCNTSEGSSEAENFLHNEFCHHFQETTLKSDVVFLAYDYCKECVRDKGANNLTKLKTDLKLYPHFQMFFLHHCGVKKRQQGVIRTNCYDCLERTNRVQTSIGLSVLLKQLTALSSFYNIDSRMHSKVHEKFRLCFKHMWLRNGTELSNIYTGDDSIFVRTVFEEITHPVIDLMLKNTLLPPLFYDRIRTILPIPYVNGPAHIVRDLIYQIEDYIKISKVQVGIGTFNANGIEHVQDWSHENLAHWLQPNLRIHSNASFKPCDIYAVGFQNIVMWHDAALITSSNETVKNWSTQIERVLSAHEPYYLVSFCQMFGICLFVFVKRKLLPFLKEVSSNFVKTEEHSFLHSKGAVAIRFSFCQSTFCFICSHLTEGYSELGRRNEQCKLILSKLSFPGCQSIDSHDHVFFFGCLNYYIDAKYEKVQALNARKDYIRMTAMDQLHAVLSKGDVLNGFKEPEIHFAPTQTFEVAGEKCPAYFNRILWKSNHVTDMPWDCLRYLPKTMIERRKLVKKPPSKCQHYGRTEMKNSENFPIFAIYHIDVKKLNEESLGETFIDVVEKTGPCNATVCIEQDVDRSPSRVNITKSEIVNSLVKALADYGVATIIRFEKHAILATFKDLSSAMVLVKKKQMSVDGHWFTVKIKTTNWIELAKLELKIESDNTTSLAKDEKETKKKVYESRIPTRSPCSKSRSSFALSTRPSTTGESIKTSISHG